MGRDYVNLHSGKRLEGVFQELSGIMADLQDMQKVGVPLDFLPHEEYNKTIVRIS